MPERQHKNRITGYREVPASELILNERNYRTHPDAQKAAMRAALEEYGWVGALIVRETEAGLEVIEGEMRQGMDEIVPVLIVDVTEEEAGVILSTMDPIGAMAITAQEAYDELVANAPAASEALKPVQAAVSDGYLVPLALPVARSTRLGAAKRAGETPEARMAVCRACSTKVRAFVDSLLKHLAEEHPEPVALFLEKTFEGASI